MPPPPLYRGSTPVYCTQHTPTMYLYLPVSASSSIFRLCGMAWNDIDHWKKLVPTWEAVASSMDQNLDGKVKVAKVRKTPCLFESCRKRQRF